MILHSFFWLVTTSSFYKLLENYLFPSSIIDCFDSCSTLPFFEFIFMFIMLKLWLTSVKLYISVFKHCKITIVLFIISAEYFFFTISSLFFIASSSVIETFFKSKSSTLCPGFLNTSSSGLIVISLPTVNTMTLSLFLL